MNPQWGLDAPTIPAKLISLVVSLTHHECDNPVCKLVSFTYGIGFPTLWRHENLNSETHEWVKQEFAAVPGTFFDQIARSANKGYLVSVDGLRGLPADFVSQSPETDARFAFIAGEMNRCFLSVSQEKTFDFFEEQRKDYHSLRIIPRYGHLDIFMGKDAVRDTFPIILEDLERPA